MSKNAANVEIFNGFNIEYPEYSIITPQTLLEFSIRALTVEEEEILKGSLVTENRLADHLNSVIYKCIVKKPESIKTFEDFMNKITIKDRDALMYGLYHSSFKDIHNYDTKCPKCDITNSVKIDFLKSFKAVLWADDTKSICDHEIKVKFEIAKNITAVIKQPMLVDEYELMKTLKFATPETKEMSMSLLIINRFEIDKPNAKTAVETIEDRDNILMGYKELPSTDRKLIDKAYDKEFGKYGVDIESIIRCKKCGNEDKISIDLVSQFFRAMYE